MLAHLILEPVYVGRRLRGRARQVLQVVHHIAFPQLRQEGGHLQPARDLRAMHECRRSRCTAGLHSHLVAPHLHEQEETCQA